MEIWILLLLGYFTKYSWSLGEHTVQYIGPNLVSEGDILTLSCITPFQDTSSWTLNGSIVITDENLLGYEIMERKLYSFYREMILRAASAQLFHSGEYRCNGNSRDFHVVKVVEDVESMEEVTEPPSNKAKRDGGERYPRRYLLEPNNFYEFLCETDSEDYPVLWYKDRQPIDSFTDTNLELYDRTLIVHNAQLEDVGEYLCRLDGSFEPGKRDVVSRYLLTSPAEIVDISKKQNVIRGRSMTLFCQAKGYPPPRITWYIGNLNAYMLKEKDLRISVYSKRKQLPNAYLTVRNMTSFDKGLYTCRAENGIFWNKKNKYREESVLVYVRDNIIEPNEDEPGIGKILIPGKPLNLHCKTEECPYCSMVWFKEGERLNSEDYLYIDEENNSLTILHPSANDTGLYECAVDKKMLNVDLRATIKVLLCEDLLKEGLTIESVCELPVPLMAVSSAMTFFYSLPRIFVLIFVACLSWMMI